MSSNNKKDISVSTIRNSDGELISSQSIDGIKYYTYKFHLFIASVHTNHMVLRGIKVNGNNLKDWRYFVELNILHPCNKGTDSQTIIDGNSNISWDANTGGLGKDIFEIITTARINYFNIFYPYKDMIPGLCIYEDGVLVLKDAINGGNRDGVVNKWYTYPLDTGVNPYLPIEVGTGWRLIRQLVGGSPNWFPGDINFTDVDDEDELLFTTGDNSRWFVTTRYAMCGIFPKEGSFTPIKAYPNVNGNRWFRVSRPYDPIISLRISDTNVRFFSENSNTGAPSDIHSSGMYVYARTPKLFHTHLSPIFSKIGNNWTLCKFLPGSNSYDLSKTSYPNQWFPGDTNFSEIHNDDELLFTTGDCSYWCITTRYDVCGTFTNSNGNARVVTAIDSNFGQTNIQIHFRSGVAQDPTIKLRNQSNVNVWRMYTEDSNNQDDVNNIHPSGMYVYSRPRQIVRYPGKYKQKTINYNDITNPTETYVNVLTGNYIIDSNGTTVENVINYKNEVIDIISTSVPDNDDIITIINEDKLTNIKTTTRKENNAIENIVKQLITENPQNYLGEQVTVNENYITNTKATIITNHINTIQYKTKTYVTDLTTNAFISLEEVSETQVNGDGTEETIITYKNVDGEPQQTVKKITTLTELIELTTNLIDKSEFETKTYVTQLDGITFVSWTEVYERQIIDTNTTKVTTKHKNEQGSVLRTIELTTNESQSQIIEITTNEIDKTEFKNKTYITDLSNNFISWTEVSDTQIIDTNTTKVTTKHKNEQGSVLQTIEFITNDNQLIEVTTNEIDTSAFKIKTYTTDLNNNFISWVEDMDSYINGQGNSEFVRNIKNESGTVNDNVQIITTIVDEGNNIQTVQTVNTIEKSEFETKRIVTLLSNEAFVSWTEISETKVNGNVEEVTTKEKDENGNFLQIETTSTNVSVNSVSILEKLVLPGTTFIDSDRKVLPPIDIPGYSAWFEPAVLNNNNFFINHLTGSYMDGQYKVWASSILSASGSNPNRIPTFVFDHIFTYTYNLYVSEDNTFLNGVSNNPYGVIIGIVLPDHLSLSYYTLKTRDSSFDQMCKKWILEASNNNTEWFVLDSRENETGWTTQEDREYYISSSYGNEVQPYRYYRWRILETNGATLVAIYGIKLYGFIYSSKLTTTITNIDNSTKVTESIAALSSVITEKDSDGNDTLITTILPPNLNNEIYVVKDNKLTNIKTTTKRNATNTELDVFTIEYDTTIASLEIIEIITDYLTLNDNDKLITTIDTTMNAGTFITITKSSSGQELFRDTEYPKDVSNNTITVIRLEVFPVVVYPNIYETTTVYQSSVDPVNIQSIIEESPPSGTLNGFIETFFREADATEILFERIVKENATDKIEIITNIASHLISDFKKRELVYTISGGVENVVSVTDTSDADLTVPGITTIIVSEKDVNSTPYYITTKRTISTSTDNSTTFITTEIVENLVQETISESGYVKQTTNNDSSGNADTITTQYAPSNNEINIVIEDVDASYPTIKFRTTTYSEYDFPNTIISITEETSPYTTNGITETIAIERNPANDAIITKTTTSINTNVSPNTKTILIENEQDTTQFKFRTIESTISGIDENVISVTDTSDETIVGNETIVVVSEKDIASENYTTVTKEITTITNSGLPEKTIIVENFISADILAEYKKETKLYNTSSGSDVLVSTITEYAPDNGTTTTVTVYDNVTYDAVYKETTIYSGTVEGGVIITLIQELAEQSISANETAITIKEYESGGSPENLVKTKVTTTNTTDTTVTVMETYTSNSTSEFFKVTTIYSGESVETGTIQSIQEESFVVTISTGVTEVTITEKTSTTYVVKTTLITENTNTNETTVVETYPNAVNPEVYKVTTIYTGIGVNEANIKAGYPVEEIAPLVGLLDPSAQPSNYTNYETDYTSLRGGYAVKHLYTGYTGPHIRISRSSDSQEMDVIFNANGISTAYESWIGTDTANVVIWYDQSGQNPRNDATAQGTVTFDYVNKRVVLGSNGYFSLPDGTVPYGNESYTLICDHGSSTVDSRGNYNGVLLHSGKNSTLGKNALKLSGSSLIRYSNIWWGRGDLYEGQYRPEQVVVCLYKNDPKEREIYATTDGVNGLNPSSSTPSDTRNSQVDNNFIGTYVNNDDTLNKIWYWNGGLYSVLIYDKALEYADIDYISNKLRPTS